MMHTIDRMKECTVLFIFPIVATRYLFVRMCYPIKPSLQVFSVEQSRKAIPIGEVRLEHAPRVVNTAGRSNLLSCRSAYVCRGFQNHAQLFVYHCGDESASLRGLSNTDKRVPKGTKHAGAPQPDLCTQRQRPTAQDGM